MLNVGDLKQLLEYADDELSVVVSFEGTHSTLKTPENVVMGVTGIWVEKDDGQFVLVTQRKTSQD